jgi:protein-S-isoprenylcysteine O-methyltransferase Ste14
MKDRMKDRMLNLRPPRIAMSLMALTCLIYGVFPTARLSLWNSLWCGLAAFFLGFVVMMWGWLEFQRKHNPICPKATPLSFINSGPFRLSRNPMYLGMLIMLMSPAIGLGSPLFLLPSMLFYGVIDFVFIPREEKVMRELFKEDFTDYVDSVRRWL